MTTPSILSTFLILMLVGATPRARAQTAMAGRLPGGPAITVLPSSRASSPPPAPALPPHPARLTSREFTGLRIGLASRLGLPEASMPTQLLANGTLATPGSTLNISPSSIPAGGGFYCNGMILHEGRVAGEIHLHPVAEASTPSMWSLCNVFFAAPITSPGIFLMTVYVDTNLPTISCRASSTGTGFFDGSGVSEIAPQGGKLFFTYESTHPNPQQIVAMIEFRGQLKPGQYFRCYSCDFVRIK